MNLPRQDDETGTHPSTASLEAPKDTAATMTPEVHAEMITEEQMAERIRQECLLEAESEARQNILDSAVAAEVLPTKAEATNSSGCTRRKWLILVAFLVLVSVGVALAVVFTQKGENPPDDKPNVVPTVAPSVEAVSSKTVPPLADTKSVEIAMDMDVVEERDLVLFLTIGSTEELTMEDLILVGDNVTFSERSAQRKATSDRFLDLSDFVQGRKINENSPLILFGLGAFPVNLLGDRYTIQVHATAADRESTLIFGLLNSQGCGDPNSSCLDSARMIEFSNILGSVFVMEEEEGTFPGSAVEYETLRWISEEDNAQIPADDEETTILVQRFAFALFSFSTNGRHWLSKFKWLSNAHVCDWVGLTCDETGDEAGLVLEMSLPKNYMKGTIPSHIGAVTSLAQIFLEENLLWGTIPHEIFEMTSLGALDVRCNNLKGEIPATLGTNLWSLCLDHGNDFVLPPYWLSDVECTRDPIRC